MNPIVTISGGGIIGNYISLRLNKSNIESIIIEKSWWVGGFIWKWFPDHLNSGGVLDTTFSPQNKPAERVIGRYFTNWQ